MKQKTLFWHCIAVAAVLALLAISVYQAHFIVALENQVEQRDSLILDLIFN